MVKKTKKRREKKSRLSDKDIIKLIKKLRPKNQQIVRVNVGDKADKKKGTAFQPNLVPVLSYAAPLPPPLPMSQQPQFQPLIAPPSLKKIPIIIQKDIESEYESSTPIKTRKGRRTAAEIRNDEMFRQERARQVDEMIAREYRTEQGVIESTIEPRFKAPKGYISSTLSASSSQPAYFQVPVQNDIYLQPSFEDSTTDSAGVIAQPLSSDLWTGTPEGEVELATQAPVDFPPLETAPAPEETFEGRKIGSQSAVEKIRGITAASAFAEEEPDWTQNVKLAELMPPTPPEPQAKQATAAVDPYLFNPLYEPDYLSNLVRDAPQSALGLMKAEIVEKLKGGFTGVPKEYLTAKTGRLKSKIPVKEMYNLYIGL